MYCLGNGSKINPERKICHVGLQLMHNNNNNMVIIIVMLFKKLSFNA